VRGILLRLFMIALPISATLAGEQVYRLGELEPSAESAEFTRSVMLPELAKLGFGESGNLTVDERVGDAAAMPGLVKQLLQAKTDAIFAVGPDALRAARAATSTVPIIIFGPNPISLGFATSLAHPGGNVTGVVIVGAEMNGKRLDLVHDAVPAARRVAALLDPLAAPDIEREIMRTVASKLGVELLAFNAAGPRDYPAAFSDIRAAGAQALVITGSPVFAHDAAQLAELAREAGIPTVCEWAAMARSGCLLGYGADRHELRRRAAHYIAQIFRGDAPGDLPIEQPTRFEFAINLKTAKALGLTIPPALLARADEVIE
jgi:putative ABC transport system substrate-binding protein